MNDIQTIEVVIIGAGPAGSMCGYLLKKTGVDCLLIDRATFPRDKICGGGLTSKAWRLLEQLMPQLQYAYNPVNHITLDVDGKVQCAFDIDDPIRIVQRRLFDHELLKQYLAVGGAFQHDGFRDAEEGDDGFIIVTFTSGERVRCRYLVGADGSNSRVRHWLKPDTGRGILAMEQYVEKSGDNSIDVGLSRNYTAGGYYFRFPNQDCDVVGFGDNATTPVRFREVMSQKGFNCDKPKGAYIYLSNDYPLHDHVILIGDAGGFAHRTTCEGLYDAFRTAQNAAESIVSGRPFREVNADIFRKKKKEERLTKVFFSSFGFVLVKTTCAYPKFVKRLFEAKMRGERLFRF